MNNKILILETGGTIDMIANWSDFPAEKRENWFSSHSASEKLIHECQLQDCRRERLMAVDSNYLTTADREKLVQACLAVEEQKILITHGTDTMVETGIFLQNQPALKNKRIALVGAMEPFLARQSEASFNLGGALLWLRTSDEPKIAIIMHGREFDPAKTRKDKERKLFVDSY